MKTIRAWWIPAEDDGEEREYEWEYLNREYGIELFYGRNQKKFQLERVAAGEYALVVLDSSVDSLEFLDDFPNRSVIAFFVSDETYSATRTCKLLMNSSIRAVYRDYPIRGFRGLSFYPRLFLSSLSMLRKFDMKLQSWLIAFSSGIAIVGKQFVMRFMSALFRKEIKHLPLGYTGSFANNYSQQFSIRSEESIITHSISGIERNALIKKDKETFFAGQRGNFDRQVFLKSALNSNLNVMRVNETYGGPVESNERKKAQKDYFAGLLDSRFSICPSGNYSVESFRFLESLLLQALPIVPRAVLSDPLYFSLSENSWIQQDAQWFRDFPEKRRIKLLLQELEVFDNRRQRVIKELMFNEANF
jgi:hypothetical protein